jgi:hypothetical protein
MAKEPHNDAPENRNPQRDGLVAHWPRIVFVVLALIGLLMMSPQGRGRLGAFLRSLTPGVAGGNDGGEQAGGMAPVGDDGKFEQLYKAEHENRKALHERLYSRKYDDYSVVDAEVVKRDPYQGYYTGDLYLNRGADSGVRIGMAVLNRDRVVVGKIVAVDRTSSVLQLLTNPDATLSVRVPARALSGITSAAKGMAREGQPAIQFPLPSLFVSALQADEAEGTGRVRDGRDPQYLRPGDVVVTNGVSDPANFADGLLVGQVSHSVPVETGASGWPSRACLIPGRLDSLRFVKIVIPPPSRVATPRRSAPTPN